MGSEILRPEQDAASTSSVEVEFALVLSRMIDSVRNDPEHLRATIYELARYKLRDQFGSDNAVDMRQLSKSLEVAVQGVEAFVAKNDRVKALGKSELGPPTPRILADASALHVGVSLQHEAVVEAGFEPTSSRSRRKPRFGAPWRFALVIAMVLVVVFAVKQRVVEIDTLKKGIIQFVGLPSTSPPKPTQVASPFRERAAAFDSFDPPSPLTPTTYGIYAISGDKLYELDMLPGRAPDIRVAVSAAILTPSRTTLPDGRIKFIVYRRESAGSAVDRAEVRVVAKVTREINFDKSGKPAVMPKIDDTWVIRNVSIPFRIAPKRGNPDMYEIQSENPDSKLTPGRYALVLKGQAYDFSVAGTVMDPKQCLERLAATNGQFYSECQKP
jgi:hypothetical protein